VVSPTAVTETGTSACPSCGEALMPGARFCEACGAATGAPLVPDPESGLDDPTEPVEIPLASRPGTCPRCDAPIDADGYCTSCGHKAVEPVDVEDKGSLAYATHRGRRHHRNEDSGAVATTAEGWPVLVVSDGVSASPNPHRASAAAVAAAAARLADVPFGGAEAVAAAVAEAHAAATAVPADGDPHWPEDGTHPACTIVVAVAAAGRVVTANVGDARGHLLRPDAAAPGGWSACQITSDDSVAAVAVAAGADPAEALSGPAGHAITAWLGADAPPLAAHVAEFPTEPGDLVMADSDGLWNYAPTDAALGDLAAGFLPAPGEPVPAAAVCERLVAWAVEAGGADNICVALAPAVPGAGADPSEREEPAQ
jgi:serine/threonine protein phosphatase PrpC